MISVSDLCVTIGGHKILNEISFALKGRDFLAVVGPNGGGKSTLLRAILGLSDICGGEIRMHSPSTDSLPSVGYVPQIKSLDRTFPALSLELVVTSIRGRWPAWISKDEKLVGMSALESVGAAHLAMNSIGSLSGGELQRVYLARALIRDPEILLLDEPETGIDASGTADLHALLEKFRSETGGLVIMVTHDWDVAYHHATHALLLNTEQIAFGRPLEALNSEAMSSAFGHIGHQHAILTGHTHDE